MFKYSKVKYNLGIYLPLVFCGFISISFRSAYTNSNLLLNNISDFNFNLTSCLNLNDIIVYNLPEAFWVFSLTLLSLDYSFKFKQVTFNLIYLPISYVWIAELFQLLNITNGTFDILDIMFASILWGMAFFLLRINKQHINDKFSLKKTILFVLVLCSVYLADISIPS